MNREYRDLSVNEPDGRLYYDLVDRTGKTVLKGVNPRLVSPVLQKGDRWSAAAANKLLRLSENGAPVLAIQPKEVGGLTRCTHRKSGSVHEISGEGEDLRFVASADFSAGDRFTLNGRAVSARTLSGEALWPGYFKNGSVVLCHKDGGVLTFSGGGGLGSADKETVKAFLAVGHSVMGGQVQGSYTADATAAAGDVRQGCTAYAKGQKLTGTYTADATARPDQLNEGATAYARGQKITGTVPVAKGGWEGNQEWQESRSVSIWDGKIFLGVHKQNYANTPVEWIGTNLPELKASNIRNGVRIGQITGTMPAKEFSAMFSVYAHYSPDWISLNGLCPWNDFTLQQDSSYEAKITVNRAGVYDIRQNANGNIRLTPGPGAGLGEGVWLSAGAEFFIGTKGGGDWGHLTFCALRRE